MLAKKIFNNGYIGKFATYLGVFVIFTFMFLQSYAIFVDNKREYPWQNEKFFVWEFGMPTPIFHLSMFGFPYYRNWEGVETFISSHSPDKYCESKDICYENVSEKITYYSTNERNSIVRNHVFYEKDTDSAGYYVYIRDPQSFTNEILQDKSNYWAENYDPVWVYTKNNGCTFNLFEFGTVCYEPSELTQIYYMPQGSIEEIQLQGF